MKKSCASSFVLCVGLALLLGLKIVPSLAMAADTPPIVANWEGTLGGHFLPNDMPALAPLE